MVDYATQAAQAPKGQEYGKAGEQMASQRQIPIAAKPQTGSSKHLPQQMGQLNGLEPGNIPTLSDPTAFPEEPVTAGLPSGPGPGPSALKSASFGPQELSVMRAVFLKYPNDDLRRLIEWTESNLG